MADKDLIWKNNKDGLLIRPGGAISGTMEESRIGVGAPTGFVPTLNPQPPAAPPAAAAPVTTVQPPSKE